jgi:hypothetical protein
MSHILGYDKTCSPYYIAKNQTGIIIVNAHTHEVTNVCECEYDSYLLHTALQYEEGNNLKLLALMYDYKKDEGGLIEV